MFEPDFSFASQVDSQMFPMVQGEKAVSTLDVVGFMMNRPFALQLEVENGQQFPLNEHPEVQSSTLR